MTYDQWFISQQGTPYEGAYAFAEAAWVHQLTRIIEQQDIIKQLREDAAEEDSLRTKMATLLAETAVALKGKEAALHRHSWHDLPVIALEKMVIIEQLMTQNSELLAALESIADAAGQWTDNSEALRTAHFRARSTIVSVKH